MLRQRESAADLLSRDFRDVDSRWQDNVVEKHSIKKKEQQIIRGIYTVYYSNIQAGTE